MTRICVAVILFAALAFVAGAQTGELPRSAPEEQGVSQELLDAISGGRTDFLKDHNNVRVVCMYKYGKDNVDAEGNHDFKGKYAQPGDIVWFELNDKTDLR